MTNHERVASVVVILFGFVVFFIGTDGFQAFTTEQARTNQLIKEQPQIPNVLLEDSKSRTYTVEDLQQDKYLFITFMYTNCATVCPQLERNMQEVYQQLPSSIVKEDIQFLSISFDPEHDDPETLEKYRTYFDSDGETWRMARINDQQALDDLLNQLGVVVIPDDYGNFQHNTAFYFVDRDGYLVNVMDYTEIDQAVEQITSVIGGDPV
ncbi:redoxin domain-containing protein [Gracilibacillus salitolerans]|uniref:Redoxin domain-containing protein n=1 Tax=Gracilibacillus salitolerans TaxID=2663022 RepID=A0A5Q2TLF0_9BACI|nr:SCO family protein [Gracilibacillus salitolerans]QGH35475.1 redoxin domain-containing protein [Gracilibacillus salitolerans]